ncbi:MAG: zf-HC2 domain-containing protein [Lachnospiraceae bacterium]|nr:zf-HC2 domain-containing protein [Lachnospiraceae bacterium]MBR5765233.1 zf-HC2 domain-containing protein [Lachnospiraceae bacterium]MBR6486029.1 zf-HC2 domain-containing protein [Lachnospiraceae bacterium]
MKCQDMEKYITLFINDRLTGMRMKEFIEHIEECDSCFDEMETNFLLKGALKRLEEEGSYDLHGELMSKIRNTKRCVEVHEVVTMLRRVMLICAGMALLFELVFVYAFYL